MTDPRRSLSKRSGRLALTNMPASGYVEYSFDLIASSANTSLSFSFRDDPGFLYLDSVTVAAAAVPEPGTLALAGLAIVGLAATRRRAGSSKSI